VVAEVADGWNTFLMPGEEYRHKLESAGRALQRLWSRSVGHQEAARVSVILGETEAETEDRVKERSAATETD
jgi:alkanesulfonate monooxygenase SsuD/methylene tetrahydromethanopterin reductase-like flavin-dependent oxidoreductase (luciferase family)